MLSRRTRVFALGFFALGILVVSGLFYTNRTYKVDNITNVPRIERIVDRENESLPNDNADLVFLRKFGRVKDLPTKDEMANMSDKQLQYIYHSYLDNTDIRCKRKIRMGRTGDGGWEVCDDFLYRPIKPCLVYSFGINHDFSFDDDAGKVYGCNVYSFDPSMGRPSHKRSDKVSFFNLGISGKGGQLMYNKVFHANRQGWSLKSLTEIKTMLKHENATLDILKVDTEFSEWSSLDDIINSGEISRVRQLLIEFHYDFQPNTIRQTMPILQKLEAQGFLRFHTHMNPFGATSISVFPVTRNQCYEIYFVNPHLARSLSSENVNK